MGAPALSFPGRADGAPGHVLTPGSCRVGGVGPGLALAL